ncbi:hypothetical protein SB778_03800 [Paraburkholderia sp. SIMBA_050]
MKHFVPPHVDPFKREHPRYVAYCMARGAATPAQQRAVDERKHGRWTLPFVYWVGHRTDDWCRETGTPRAAMGFAEQQQFTEWLVAQHPVSEPSRPQPVLKRANARSGS